MNMTRFFDRIRGSLYGGSLKQITVDNINKIVSYWAQAYSDNVEQQLAYILATVLAEVGRDMNPVRETFARSDEQARYRLRHKAYAQSTPPYGHAYYGRGYVQLTWIYNYQRQEDKLNIPLVKFPDMALATEIAVQILVGGMMDGDFNGSGRGLEFYINRKRVDFVHARRTVNVLNRASEIAGYAEAFWDAIEYAKEERLMDPSVGVWDAERAVAALMLPSVEHLEAQREFFVGAKTDD
ncbi:hypothetical protein [Mesorhizobium sp. M0618]|uniref:hypothetical protein n=1 Tax=unclassified Mesorhizobium TaxID=325217 RepID=UPI003337DED6